MPDDLAGKIEDTKLADALSERYLAYALSTIMSRSLPDVRDGLKPVHRRLVYAMHQLRLDPTAGFKKCARVIGDVIGKYHPHGDASVYEALVRLAQDFAARFPLVEGQGNFGNIDGDNAAAMRYTEARLTEVAKALLAGIDDDAVDFRPTYDGEESEPVVLPGGIPQSAGQRLGRHRGGHGHHPSRRTMPARCAPPRSPWLRIPHHYRRPARAHARPGFPHRRHDGRGEASILAAYETGRGGFRVRAKWAVESRPLGTWRSSSPKFPTRCRSRD